MKILRTACLNSKFTFSYKKNVSAGFMHLDFAQWLAASVQSITIEQSIFFSSLFQLQIFQKMNTITTDGLLGLNGNIRSFFKGPNNSDSMPV